MEENPNQDPEASSTKGHLLRRLGEDYGAGGLSEMEGFKAATDKEKEAPESLPFSRMDVLGINIDSNPNLEIVCSFGKLGDRPVHVLIAIAYACANGDLTESEASRLHFEVLHSISMQIEDSPSKNLVEARLLRVEALARVISTMREKLNLGEKGKLKNYQVDAILGSAASLQAADALDPTPTKVSHARTKTRRLVFASGIAGLAMGIGTALGTAYPEKVKEVGSSIGAAVKDATDWVSKKLE